jgi:hypothetical protein
MQTNPRVANELIRGYGPLAGNPRHAASAKCHNHDTVKPVSRLALLLASVSLLIAATGTATAQPMTGSISAYAQAYAYNANLSLQVQPPTDTSTQTEYWNTNPISPLSVSTFATQTADAGSGPSSGTASMSETATWAPNGTSGTFTSDYTLSSSTAASYVIVGVNNIPFGGNPDNLYNPNVPPQNWGFEFTATASGNFVLDYDITQTGAPTGLMGFSLSGIYSPLYASENDGQGYLSTGVNSSGEFVAPVVAGQTYTLGLGEQSNYGGSALDITGSVDADFSWTLPGASSSVPDGGATLAMLGMGVAGLAFLRRRFA